MELPSAVVSAYAEQLAPPTARSPVLRAGLRAASDWLSTTRSVALHLLSPFESDPGDAFSVIDDGSIAANLGSWDDLAVADLPLVLDCVVNQRSTNSREFKRFSRGEAGWASFFYRVPRDFDLTACTAPRGRAPVVEDRLEEGLARLWSSHGGHQRDLNYDAIEVRAWTAKRLRRLAAVATHIRLDGVAFSYKRSGTTCANLPEAQRLCADLASVWGDERPGGAVIAEVDWPAAIGGYLKDGGSGGPDLVYDYGLAPCVAAAVVLGDTRPLVAHLEQIGRRPRAAWCNMASTHDGLSLRPWASPLSRRQANGLALAASSAGTRVAAREMQGERQPYEIACTVADLARMREPAADGSQIVSTVNTLVIGMKGVPSFYLPSVLGELARTSDADPGEPRSAVRCRLAQSLSDHPGGVGVLELLRLREEEPALAASAPLRVVQQPPGIVWFDRGSKFEVSVVCNFTPNPQIVTGARRGVDLRTGEALRAGRATLAPWEGRLIRWDSPA
jgi:hypothetical protein